MSEASSNNAEMGTTPSSGAGGTSGSQSKQSLNCPLLSLGLTSGAGKTRTLPCSKDECAWWNRAAKRCAVVAGYER